MAQKVRILPLSNNFKDKKMIRITRFIAKDRVFDVLYLPFVSKIELHSQGNRTLTNPAICKVNIYLIMQDETSTSYNRCLNKIDEYGIKNNNTKVRALVSAAKTDGFFQEKRLSLFPDSLAKEYRGLCAYYSKEFFDLFNHHKV